MLKDQMRNLKNYNHPLISHPSENFSPMNSYGGGGLLYAPPHPSLSYSYPPAVQYYHHRQQPPLLPLPILPNPQNFNPSRARGVSCPPVNRKIKNKNTPAQRKSKPNNVKTNPVIIVDSSIAKRFGPEPNSLPLSRVLLSNNNNNNNNKKNDSKVVVVTKKQVDEFSGSVVYTDISPPPSSLPLPTFFLRPKLSCNVEAAASVDDGATNDLRRLLRLR